MNDAKNNYNKMLKLLSVHGYRLASPFTPADSKVSCELICIPWNNRVMDHQTTFLAIMQDIKGIAPNGRPITHGNLRIDYPVKINTTDIILTFVLDHKLIETSVGVKL